MSKLNQLYHQGLGDFGFGTAGGASLQVALLLLLVY